MKRRTVLVGGVTVAASAFLPACSSAGKAALRLSVLEGSIPNEVINAFESPIDIVPIARLIDSYSALQRWKDQPVPPLPLWRRLFARLRGNDVASAPSSAASEPQAAPNATLPRLVTLSDYWLMAAISQGLIQPMEIAASQAWQQLPQAWQQLMRRNQQGEPDVNGQIWGMPYRVQSLMMIYHRPTLKNLGIAPQSWQDLWHPKLKQRIALPENPRLVLSLVLKKLGDGINDEAAMGASQLQAELQALHAQVKTYDSATAFKALVNRDVDVAVGWSADVLNALTRYQTLGAVLPQEGTVLSGDIWVNPLHAETILPNSSAQPWLDFCLQPGAATEITRVSGGVSPLFFDPAQRPPQLENDLLRLPEPKLLAQSEALLPLSQAGQQTLEKLWGQLSRG
jgi:putative spermidine/putrescine transport system substrate-binding protein